MILSLICAFFEQIGISLIMLLIAMAIDYVTGIIKAYMKGTLSSKIGIRGIIKKTCYLLVVACGAICDWMIRYAFVKIGIELSAPFPIALLITVWLIINELISVLENLTEVGVPMPSFLARLISRLALTLESKAEEEKEEANDGK